MFDYNILASNIKSYRKSNGMTQQSLAKALMVSPQSISKWECGAAAPDLENLCVLAEILHVSVDSLLGTVTKEQCMIGIDGGGTKTEFVLFTMEGNVVKRLQKKGCNPNVCGFEESISILKSGIDELMRETNGICGIYVGSAGMLSGDYKKQANKFLKRMYPQTRIDCDTDILNIVSSATENENCIAAICGTGMIVYTNINGILRRIGGWGYLLDQGGSGFDIGRDALGVALAQRDGFGAKSIITELIEERIGGRIWEHINNIYQGGNSYIASFAPIVTKAYEQGDKLAKEILEKNASRTSMLINYAAENFDNESTLVMSGSLICKDLFYRELVKERLNPKLSLVIPETPPVYGACIRCCALCDVHINGIKEKFMQTYNAAELKSDMV